MLDIVEDQQQVLWRPGSPAAALQRSAAPSSRTPSAVAIAAGTRAGSASGASGTKKTPSGKASSSSAAACRAKPRLAGAAGAGQRQQLHIGPAEQRADLCHLALATQEGRRLTRQVVGPGLERLQGRELIGQVRVQQLEDPLRLQQIAQPVLAQVAQLRRRGQGAAGQLLHRLGEQDLPAVPVARSRESRLRGAAR